MPSSISPADRLANSLQAAVSRNASTRLDNAVAKQDDHAEMDKACKEFESLFIQHLFKEMRQTLSGTELFSGGRAEKIYTGMMDAEVARSISSGRGIGLAGMVRRQLMPYPQDGGQTAQSSPTVKKND